MALCAAVPVLWMVLGVVGPLHAQTNSPSGGENTGQSPTQGAPNAETGPNVGGDGQAGNRTTPGGGGATGGGSSGGGSSDTADGGNAGPVVGVVLLLAAVGIAFAIARRHRRVMEHAGAGGSSPGR